MTRISYEQAYADHCYLWGICPAGDMTGGYVDQDDLALLLRRPTKATARDCLCAQINRWFSAKFDLKSDGTASQHIASDPKVRQIAIRHGHAEDDDDE